MGSKIFDSLADAGVAWPAATGLPLAASLGLAAAWVARQSGGPALIYGGAIGFTVAFLWPWLVAWSIRHQA